ncbi:retrovirus-related Pol polyprotein from transposon opus [Trichonephila clavipes]|nr:retrovirus-related Pol polyprotein from transposon opus [Trichonephila clavipes]
MEEMQAKRKTWYDKNAVKREFKDRDLVLVLATSRANKLAVQWIGSGKILNKISETNYLVGIPGRRETSQIYHINMLRPYYKRPEHVNVIINDETQNSLADQELEIPYLENNSLVYDFEDVIQARELNKYLHDKQMDRLRELLNKYSKCFSNNPGLTNLVEHEIQSENFNLFFQSLERAFLTKKINDEYKSEILINLLGERAHNVLLYIKEEELNDYEKLKSIVLREFQLTPRECLNSFKNAVKSSGETCIQFAARSTANFQYYCSLRKVNSFESLCDLIISDKLFETLNKETATHIGIREAEDWFRPIDLAKECDIYISSRSGSHKETPITYGYTQDPFKNRSQNFKTKIKENYPQYLERENKNCFICGDSSHCARDCEKRFKPKESNSHIHNKINVNTLKVESEKQNSDEFENLQYVNIFVENQPVTALIDSGCQIPVLNSSLIRVQTPSEEIITLSSCFGEQRMVEVKPINISLNQHSPGISVRMAISPTLTEEFIIHPSVYSEIEKLGHAKSDVLLSESESSLSADYGVSFPNVSVSNVIENSSYDLPYVKNFNTRNDSSSLIKDYKLLCKKANGAMKTSSVEFISHSPNPLPMKSEHRRFVLLGKFLSPGSGSEGKREIVLNRRPELYRGKISMRSTKDQLVKKTFLCL